MNLLPHEMLYHECKAWVEEYKITLKSNLAKSTVTRHIQVCNMWAEFILELDIQGFEDITGSMCGSRFVQFFNNHTNEGLALVTVKNILKGFFTFIHSQHGIYNPKLIAYFGR